MFTILGLVFIQTLSEIFLPTLMADIVDIGIVYGDINYIMRIGGIMLLVAAGGTICSIGAGFLTARTGVGFGSLLRSKVFSHVESFSLHEFDKFGTATLITRNTNDINQVQMVTIVILRMMVQAPLLCLGGIIMALSMDKTLTLVLVAVLPIIAGIITITAKKGIPLFKLMQLKIDKLNLVLREALTGIRVIRAFNRTEKEERRFDDASTDLTKNAIKVNKIMAVLMPTLMLVMNLTIIAIIWFGGIRVDHGQMQVGSLMAFIQYAMLIMSSIIMVSMLFIMIPRASASAMRINEVLDVVTEISDPQCPEIADRCQGEVEFRNVTFRYPGAEKPVLKDISFRALPGEITAIIGGTGSGKSTLINLIPRFYDIEQGSILIDGVDVYNMTQASLRAKIGLVPQKTVLFSGTVNENISYGRLAANQNEIRQAADTAQATEFVLDMEEGFDSLIAQGGTNLSGGQRQRLSIARALVRRPEIYIFDDCFSALDYKTDARLRHALKKETTGATVIIIAQRVATIMDSDQIIVLDDGHTVGIGTHQQLMDSCEVYREIVYSQLSEEELA